VTESLQLADQSLGVRLAGSPPVEVILAELLVGHLPLQHVVTDHQNRVPHRNGSFLGTTPSSEAGVVCRELGPLGALTGLGRATFASRLLVAAEISKR
jgi:hypothetical protein